MSKYIVDEYQLISLADAIREKSGSSDPLTFSGMVSAVSELGGGDDYLASACNKTITELNNSEILKVPTYMFFQCYSLSKVNLPNCTQIDTNAFNQCSNLEEISLPNCSSIATSAFQTCSKLSSVYLPNCTYLGSYVFYGCSSMYSAYLPNLNQFENTTFNSSTSYSLYNYTVSEYCFTSWGYGQNISDNFTFSMYLALFNSKVMIVSNYSTYTINPSSNPWYNSTTGILTFPESVGYVVGSTFSTQNTPISSWYQSITGISGPGITTIGHRQFVNLQYLSYINCPNLVTMGFSTSHKVNITTCIIGNLIYCGPNALRFVTNYSSIPSDLNRCICFGDSAFYNKSSLNISINLELCSYIGQYAFWNCSSLNFYGILENCSSIGSGAFIGCSYLSSIIAPKVTNLQSSAFRDCTNLSIASIPNTVYVRENTFYNCYSLKEVYLSECLYMHSNVFAYCSEVESIYAPKCSSVMNLTFGYCSKLSDLTLDWDKLQIYGTPFEGCSELISLHADDNMKYISVNGNSKYILFSNNSSAYTLKESPCYLFGRTNPFQGAWAYYLSVPNLKYVPSSAFNGWRSLYSFYAENCSIINGYAFQSCSNLQTVSFPNCKTIGYSAFYSCSYLKEVEFPKVTATGQCGFMACNRLSKVSMPLCKTVQYRAFFNCQILSDIYLPEVTIIDTECFYYNSFSQISLPKLTQITGYSAFYGCRNLTSFEALSLTSIATANMFDQCSQLQSVNISISYSSNNNNGFYYGNMMFRSNLALTYVSISLTNGYYTTIGSMAFQSCYVLPKFSLNALYSSIRSDTQVYIGSYAFQNCSLLSKVLLSDLRNSIYSYNGNSTYWPYIGSYAFSNCSTLMSIYLFTNLSIDNLPIWNLSSSNAFDFTPITHSEYTGSYGSIYVQSKYLDSYKANVNWSWFSDRFVGLTDEEVEQVTQNW